MYTQYLYRAGGHMGALQAVPDEPVDLSSFDVGLGGPPADRRWRQVLAELSPDDQALLRAALDKVSITPNAIGIWLERHGLVVDPRTIKGWRRRGYAVTA